jgi:DNA-binding MarR family transcriptional regulator
MCNDYFDFHSSLGFMTITTNRLLKVYLRKQFREAGISLTAEQWGVLAHIWNRGGISQDELAHCLCVDKSSLSRVLNGMERKGLVARRRDSGDARGKKLHTTPKADEWKARCRLVARATLDSLRADVKPEELDICLKVLAQVQTTMRKLSK